MHCDSASKLGGVGFYIKKAITYKLKRNINLSLTNVEDQWIEVLTNTDPAAIGVIYRHPSYLINDYELFSSSLCDILCQFNAGKMPFYAVGDYNIDLMRVNANSSVKNHVHYMINLSCKCVIDLHTRITSHSQTLLHHIYVSDNTRHVYTSGVLLTNLSDHYGTFMAVAEKKSHLDKPKVVQIRDMSNFDLELFLQVLEQHLRDAELENNDAVNEKIDKFCVTFNSVVNKFATLRKASCKVKRLQAKPWLTKGLLKSIKRKHTLFFKLQKALHSDQELNYKKI